jgi:pimeloyl-ACP methyl ester carboxylesterase
MLRRMTRVVVTLLAALLGLAAGPARAAPTALDLWLGGRETTVDVFMPAAPARDAVVLAHGFSRTRITMSEHAERLARDGLLVVAPDLPFFWHSGDNAQALRDLVAMLVAGKIAPPVSRVVLVGFSAGGLAALLAADAPGVAGYVGLDPFDRASGLGRDAAKKLHRPAYLIRAPGSRCNAFAIAEPWKVALPKLIADRVVPDATHCDFESPTDWVCRAACGGSDDARRKAIADALDGAVRGVLARPAP